MKVEEYSARGYWQNRHLPVERHGDSGRCRRAPRAAVAARTPPLAAALAARTPHLSASPLCSLERRHRRHAPLPLGTRPCRRAACPRATRRRAPPAVPSPKRPLPDPPPLPCAIRPPRDAPLLPGSLFLSLPHFLPHGRTARARRRASPALGATPSQMETSSRSASSSSTSSCEESPRAARNRRRRPRLPELRPPRLEEDCRRLRPSPTDPSPPTRRG